MSSRGQSDRRAFLRAAGAAGAATVFIGWRGAQPDQPAGASVTAFTLIHGIPGREEELKEHLVSLTAPTRAEQGCITYDLYQSPSRKHEFLRFEVWSSIDALEAHKRSPHLRASFEKRQREGWTTEIVLWDPVR
jgi:quinol monooxygenase YgiN